MAELEKSEKSKFVFKSLKFNTDVNLNGLGLSNVDKLVVAKCISDAQKLLEEGKYKEVIDLLDDIEQDIAAVERLRYLAYYEVDGEEALSKHYGYINGHNYLTLLSLCNKTVKASYEAIERYCRERYDARQKIVKRIEELKKLLDVDLINDALDYAKKLCKEHPDSALAWAWLIEVKLKKKDLLTDVLDDLAKLENCPDAYITDDMGENALNKLNLYRGQVGSTVKFGEKDWTVLNYSDGIATLICNQSISYSSKFRGDIDKNRVILMLADFNGNVFHYHPDFLNQIMPVDKEYTDLQNYIFVLGTADIKLYKNIIFKKVIPDIRGNNMTKKIFCGIGSVKNEQGKYEYVATYYTENGGVEYGSPDGYVSCVSCVYPVIKLCVRPESIKKAGEMRDKICGLTNERMRAEFFRKAPSIYNYPEKEYKITDTVFEEYIGEKGKDVIIPAGVTQIAAGAFKGKVVRNVTFVDRIENLQVLQGAFSGCLICGDIIVRSGNICFEPKSLANCSVSGKLYIESSVIFKTDALTDAKISLIVARKGMKKDIKAAVPKKSKIKFIWTK